MKNNYGRIIAVLLTIILGGGSLIVTLAQRQLNAVEAKQGVLTDRVVETEKKVQVLENEISHIKKTVDETRGDVKYIKELLMRRDP